jgi:hypothetical protein
VLTCPASWAARRRDTLAAAAARAGVPNVRLVDEPVAAGHYVVDVLGSAIPAGGHLLVFDAGAGTVDVSVLRRAADGFTVLASQGLADAGGLDVDAAIMAHLVASHAAGEAGAWGRVTAPGTAADRRRSRQSWDAVRVAKETLSRTGSTLVHLPVFDRDAPLGREQLDALARPVLDRMVATARGVLLDAGIPVADLVAIVPVGGASRMPLVATLLHRAFGVVPTAIEQPELVVAEGSLAATRAPADAVPVATVVSAPPAVHPPPGPVTPARGFRRRTWITAGVIVAVLALVSAVGVLLSGGMSAASNLFPGHHSGAGAGPGGHGRAGGTSSVPAGIGGDSTRPAGPSSTAGTATGPPVAGGGTPSPHPAPGSAPPQNPVLGPTPKPSFTVGGSYRSCRHIYLQVTRTAGTATTWPDSYIYACANAYADPQHNNDLDIIDGQGGVYGFFGNFNAPNSIRGTYTFELRQCSGGSVVETVHREQQEATNNVGIGDFTKNYPRGLKVQVTMTLASFEIHSSGSVWTVAPGSVTSDCF